MYRARHAPERPFRRTFVALATAALTLVGTTVLAPAAQAKASPAKGNPKIMVTPPVARERAAKRAGFAGPGGDTSTDMSYHGGPVMRDVTTYAIWWAPTTLPAGYPGSLFGPTYRDTIERYLTDISGTPYFDILTQYRDSSGLPVPNSTHFGGAWTDTTTYPHAGTSGDPLGDGDLDAAITRAIAANPTWQTGALNTMYFVFTGKNIIECSSAGNCFSANDYNGTPAVGGAFCAYHWWNGTQVYGFIPYASTGNCYGNQTAYPNGVDQDIAITVTSHEQFEAYTDPLGTAWYDNVDGIAGENGDKCAYNYGPYEPDGSNIVLHGHPYQIQTEWSNEAPHGCVKRHGPRPQTTITGDLAFGTVARGTTETREVAVQNTGNGDLNVLDVRLATGSNAAYALSPSTNKTSTLAPGDTSLLKVSVSPAAGSSSSGPLNGTLVVDTDDGTPNDTGQPTTAQLTATNNVAAATTVGLPKVKVSGSLNFGTVPRGTSSSRTVVVQNIGDATLGITNITFSGDPAYAISPASPTSGSLPPGGSLVVEVTFSPPGNATAPGPLVGTLTVATNDPATPSVTTPATGTVGLPKAAVSPGSINFGVVCPGDFADRELTVTNTGTAPLTISNISIGGGSSAGLSILPIPGLPQTLPVGGHLAFTVRFAPAGPLGGPISGTVVVDTDDPVNPQVTVPITGSVGAAAITLGSNALDFGGRATDNRTSPHTRDLPVTVTNTGNCALSLTALAISGPAASDFAVVGAPALPVSIGPGATLTLTVRFNPSASGVRNGSLDITTSDPVNPNVSVSLTGLGLVPAILTSSSSLVFPPTVILSQAPGYTGTTKPLTVTNTGQAELIVDVLSTASPFYADGPVNPPSRYATNNHFSEPVRFGPTVQGLFSGTLLISDTDPEGGASANVALCGEGVKRGIRVLAVNAAGVPFASVKMLKLQSKGTAQNVNVNLANLSLGSVPTSCDVTQQMQYQNQLLPATDTLNQRASYYTLSVTAGGKSTTVTFPLGVSEFKTMIVTIK
jgi:hypothetical protein